MRVYISADMEGIAGVVHDDHTARSGQDYEQARLLMTKEANAAVKGARAAGATEIILNDSHGTMRNIYIEKLAPHAKLISGSPKKLGMMEGIDRGFDAAVFIGYHTKNSTQGILNHSYDGGVGARIRINGEEFGEFGLNALVAGEFNVPVVFVSGCDQLAKEAKAHIPEITAAEVKRTINQAASENLHPEVAQQLIKEGVEQAILRKQAVPPYRLDVKEYSFELQFSKTLYADIADTLPIVTKIDPLTVAFQTNTALGGYLIARSLIKMANQGD